MRIEVDADRCEGHAMCEAIAPDYFVVDDAGELTVLRVEPLGADEQQVQRAVDGCPVTALRLAVSQRRNST